MAFGARNENGGWRLAFRKGRCIYTAYDKKHNIVFKDQKSAKACADELNDRWWKQYFVVWNEFAETKESNLFDLEMVASMLKIIVKHGGLPKTSFEEIREELAF